MKVLHLSDMITLSYGFEVVGITLIPFHEINISIILIVILSTWKSSAKKLLRNISMASWVLAAGNRENSAS